MSVEGTTQINQLGWNGYLDPGLPAGHWQANLTIVGDDTLGFIGFHLVFSQAGAPLTERLFNLELFRVRISNNGAFDGILQFINLGFQPTLVVPLVLRASDTGIGVASLSPEEMGFPIWLGPAQIRTGVTELEALIPNADGETFRVGAQGYFWDADAILAPGGPRRPLDALYGH